MNRRVFLSSAAAAASLACMLPLRAQGYPTRPITLILPFPPGSLLDFVGRMLTERLSAALGQPVMIEHRPGGAGGTIGARVVATAEPDGHTLLLSTPGPLVVAPAIYRNLGYDPARHFAPVATVVSSPQILAVNSNVPARTLAELVAFARANPRAVNFASPGYGTQPHLLGEMLRLQAGIDIVHVPYKGPAQIVTDLIAGQVQMIFENIQILLPHIEAGRIRALAVADRQRSDRLPSVATTVESGFADLQATYWGGILAPAGTPASVIARLNDAVNAALKSDDMNRTLQEFGVRTKISSPESFSAFMAVEASKWSAIVRAADIKVE
jgi:tripartite-type tricarboxylate transporter receptor subunit TctC